jgi:hypothetical protein
VFGGKYASENDSLTNNRNGREQHSFHLHGHHFWQVCVVAGLAPPRCAVCGCVSSDCMQFCAVPFRRFLVLFV